MIVAFLLVTLAQAASPAAAPPPRVATIATAAPPADWSALPDLRFHRKLPELPELSTYVKAEVAAGRCAAPARAADGYVLKVDMAVLVGAGGQVRRIVPRAIDCVTVEQYASGLLSRLARGNIEAAGIAEDSWFRANLIFSWSE